ncbi:MAG: trypsin-like peptidase domain-containing protein [Balneolaceae bacterium]|nr:trypsin-like peptidase domain-containing protein [Balneolaceae bacterium]
MKLRDKILSSVLLLLIGIMLGMIVMLFRQGSFSFDLAEVRFTEVNRSETPFWSNEDLEKIDDRFVFRNVARNVTPTVVFIETVISNRNRGLEQEAENEDGFWERFLPPRARTVGSGVIISSDGYILTNNHVIEDALRDGITITLDDKRSYDGRVVGRDPSTDLAVLKVDAVNLPAVTVGNSDLVEVGEWVMAIGNPFRLRSTVTAGIVGALSRDVQIINDDYRIESFIQTDAAINRGNSGGALVNTSGELIGINTAIATQSGSYQGYGFAVPSNLALKVARDIIEFGEVQRGMMGVSIQTVDARIARRIGLETIEGVAISGIGDNSAASEAGLRPDDVILAVNGNRVNESNKLQEKVAMFRPHDEIVLTVWRRGETLDRTLKLRERPEPEPVASRIERFDDEPELDEWSEIPGDGRSRGIEQKYFDEVGFTLRALSTPEDPNKFNIYIHRVDRNSEAWNRGLRDGKELLELNNAEANDLRVIEKEISNFLQNNRSLNLKVQTREGNIGYYKLY